MSSRAKKHQRNSVKNKPFKGSDIRERLKAMVHTIQEQKRAIAQPKTPETVCRRCRTKEAGQETDNSKPKTTIQQGTKTFELSKILPCMTLEELDSFLLKVLEDESLYYGLVSYIESTLGNDICKSIKSALDLIMDRNVQSRLSWTGIRTAKPSLEKCYRPIINCMNEAFKQKFKGYNYAVLKKKIQTLLTSS